MQTRTPWTRKFLFVLAIVSVTAISTAGATHVFDDVEDGRFFAEPVEWASDNGITTGTSETTFEPDRGVTRGESVTFLKRYDDNIVQPALEDTYTKDEVDAAVEAATPAIYHAAVNPDGTTRTGTSDGVSVDYLSAGAYEVQFPPDDIRACIFHATLVGEPFGIVFLGPPAPEGDISLAEDWDGAFPASADPDSVFVSTTDNADTAADASFHLSVFC